MNDLPLSLADALAVHNYAVQPRVATEQTLDTVLATGSGLVTGDDLILADRLTAAEVVEHACADQVARLLSRPLSSSGIAK